MTLDCAVIRKFEKEDTHYLQPFHCVRQVANMIKGKTPDEIRKTFNIKNDFTPAEEEQVWHAGYPVDTGP